jgi:hypothetical protein
MGQQDRMSDTASDELLEVGGPVDELSACLAVYGEDLTPGDVTKMLGVEPSYSFRRGHRRGASPPAPHGAWILKVRALNHPHPGALIGTLLSKLPQDAEIWRQLNDRFKVQLRIGIHMQGWNKGFGFDAKTASQLAAIGAEVTFDIYAYGEDETGEN